MIPKRAIELSIKGGWNDEWLVGDKRFADIALDPSFWQSLGKALGWKAEDDPTRIGYTWQGNASRFYDLILTGGDTKTFWDELLKSKSV